MKKESGIASVPARPLVVLSVSALAEDHLSLQAIVGHSTCTLFEADDCHSALSLLELHEIAVVLCEQDVMPGTWKNMLGSTNRLPNAPSLIVTSRLADDRLWVEALNLGAWDVLGKPFDRSEVIRSVKSAWQHWHHRNQMAAMPAKTMEAG